MNPGMPLDSPSADGDRVRLSNSRGDLTTDGRKSCDRVPEGLAWFPDHFAQEALQLFDCVDRSGHESRHPFRNGDPVFDDENGVNGARTQ